MIGMRCVNNRRARLSLSAVALVLTCASFAQEVPQSVKDAVKRADDAISGIVAIPTSQRTFENTVKALDDATDQLSTDTSLFIFQQNVAVDSSTRESARAADELVNNWSIQLGKREDLFQAIKAFADTHPTLTPLQQRLLNFTLRDYRRAGMDLPKATRDHLQQIEEKVGKLQIDFNQNVADDPTILLLTHDDLKGVPDNKLTQFQKSGSLYMIPLGENTYDVVVPYATNDEVRHKIWLAWKRRGGQKNVEILEKIIKLRNEQANLLGFPTTAAFETDVRMAKTPAKVQEFYQKLRPIVRKKALKDLEELTALKRQDTHNPKAVLNPWDLGYYETKLKKQKYAVDDNKVSEYFPADRVIKGLFDITQSLYGVTFKDVSNYGDQNGKPLWAPGVRYYEVQDRSSGKSLGHFYLDLYPRTGKYTHAACWGLVGRRVRVDGTVQLPIAALVVNVTKPENGHPALLPHSEVETIFHEFGHCLHNVLTKADYARFSGTSVELDFVEAPSQMFENWVWSPTVLKTFARHYKTGKPIPEDLLKGMMAARNLGSGLMTEGQIYLGMMDQAYYTARGGVVDTTKVSIDLVAKAQLLKGYPGTMSQASFGHLMHYQAGYYSYLWSLVYAQDMFQRFEAMGLLNPKAGQYYREHILAMGSTEDADKMVHDYLGRDPRMEPFLRHLGLK